MIARLILLAALVPAALSAQGFDPAEYFGSAWTASEDGAGTIKLDLRGNPLPPFVGVGSTGATGQTRLLTIDDDGMRMAPGAGRATVAVSLDLGISAGSAGVTVAEMDVGCAVAWRVQGWGENAAQYLAELERGDEGFTLRLRAHNGRRFVQIPDAVARVDAALPTELRVEITAKTLRATLSTANLETSVSLPHGASLALAASDGTARVHTLFVSGKPSVQWKTEAGVRLLARRALGRLREFATAGLLAGTAAFEYPGTAEALAEYTEEQRRVRERGRAAAPGQGMHDLMMVAAAMPDSALAAHEAGVAALLAGAPATGHRLLTRAAEASATPVTLLALAEACRQVRDSTGAMRALQRAREKLPPKLEPDLALIEARLLADSGRLADAHAALESAAAKHAGHEQLGAFAASARMLTQGADLRSPSMAAPLGLRLQSDLSEEELQSLATRVAPYIDAIRAWLPDLPAKVDGRLLILRGPVDYLNAALLVAGDELDSVAGLFVPEGIEGKPTILACRAFGEDELVRTMVHELWHLALSASGAVVPRWLDEGMAVMLSAGRVEGDGLVYDRVPGEFASDIVAQVAADAQRVRDAVTAQPAEFYEAGRSRENYAAAWAIVWYHARSQSGRDQLRQALGGDAKAQQGMVGDVGALLPPLTAALKALN